MLRQQMKRELLTDVWFRDHQGELTLREGLAWKGDKLYVPSILQVQVWQQSHNGWPLRVLKDSPSGQMTILVARDEKGCWELCKMLCGMCRYEKETREEPGVAAMWQSQPGPGKRLWWTSLWNSQRAGGGSNVIWTVINLFSKQAHFVPCSSLPSAQKLTKLFLQHVYCLHRVLKRIISDHSRWSFGGSL